MWGLPEAFKNICSKKSDSSAHPPAGATTKHNSGNARPGIWPQHIRWPCCRGASASHVAEALRKRIRRATLEKKNLADRRIRRLVQPPNTTDRLQCHCVAKPHPTAMLFERIRRPCCRGTGSKRIRQLARQIFAKVCTTKSKRALP